MFKVVQKLGFTMIELLIVIAVLGILAVAVLAAINPIEQINRGKDTGSRSDAEQLLSASDRYYASKGYYPWTSGANSTNTMITGGAGATATLTKLNSQTIQVGNDVEQILNNLSTGGSSELKASFITRISDPTYNFLSIYNNGGSGASTYLCFVPKSNSFKEEAWKRCSNAGHTGLNASIPIDFPAAACPNDGTCAQSTTADLAVGCYICLP
jgi:prepilin-type N-terminal cleavage/methylation domain-containing protein